MRRRGRAWSLVRAELLLGEANSRLESGVQRLTSVDQRLGLLVGAAAVAGSLATATKTTGWSTLAICLTGVAVILGLTGTLPRNSYPELPWIDTRAELWNASDAGAILVLADRRLELSQERDKLISRKARILSAGYTALALAVVALLLSVTVGSFGDQGQGQHPSPSSSPS